jgi:hypothetical protein
MRRDQAALAIWTFGQLPACPADSDLSRTAFFRFSNDPTAFFGFFNDMRARQHLPRCGQEAAAEEILASVQGHGAAGRKGGHAVCH